MATRIPTVNRRHPTSQRLKCHSGLVVAILAASLTSGCTVSRQLGTESINTETVTGSISQQAKQDGLDKSDAETIKSTVIAADSSASANHALAWTNPETGNSGEITTIKDLKNKQGSTCRKFETTVNSYGGLTIYNGETCKTKQGTWFLSWLLPKDFGV